MRRCGPDCGGRRAGAGPGRPAAEATRGSPTQAAAAQALPPAATAKSRISRPKKHKNEEGKEGDLAHQLAQQGPEFGLFLMQLAANVRFFDFVFYELLLPLIEQENGRFAQFKAALLGPE